MDKIYVVFWTQSGNTQAMAQAVAEGITAAGKTPELVFVSEIPADALKDEAAFALGCPAMGAEVLEESEMEPFMMELDGVISGKNVALFGSYGWGNQEWMRDWEDRISQDGATVVNGEGVTVNGAPDGDVADSCRELGRALAGMV